MSSFDWDSKRKICIIHEDNFVYFLGGRWSIACLSNANRYNLIANLQVEKLIAELIERRSEA